jgi:hypothetical protein
METRIIFGYIISTYDIMLHIWSLNFDGLKFCLEGKAIFYILWSFFCDLTLFHCGPFKVREGKVFKVAGTGAHLYKYSYCWSS